MKSGLNISATRLENMRQRRMNRIRRQRAIEVGKPVDVSLKSMALNSAQQKELSNLRLQPHVNPRHQSVTPNRVSVLVALGIHLIAVLLGAIFIVSPTRLDAEATIVDIVHFIPARNLADVDLRRLPPNGVEDPLDPIERGGCPIPNPEPTRPDAFVPLEVTRHPAFRTRIEPKYPRTARLAQKEGQVVLTATIDVDGRAKDIKVKEDNVGFGCARAAIDALVASLFRPGERGVEIVPIRIAIPYQFKLEDEAARANRQQSRVNHRSPQTPIENDSVKIVEVGCW